MSQQEIYSDTALKLKELTAWAADYEAMDIPESIYRRAAIVLCDDLAAIISARQDPVLSQIREQMLKDGGKPVATVFCGGDFRTDRFSAAVANAIAAPWNELDEGSLRVSCHSGIYVLPALLAEAEAEGLSTRELLRSLVVAYEVVTRFAMTFPQPEFLLHPHAAFAAVGAAAAIAAARRYNAQLFFNTITAAATLVNPGPFDHAVKGSFVRNMWVATAAWSGLKAANWALCGVAGLTESPDKVFNGVFGFGSEPENLVIDLGKDWLIEHSFQKIYPCCQFAHSTIEAITSLIPTLPEGVELRNAEQIIVETHEKGCLLDEVDPVSTLSARFSIPHIAAVAAIHGRVDVQSLSAASLSDQDVSALRHRVLIRPYQPELPPPNDRPARVSFLFADGQEFQSECLCARGSPSTPLGIDAIRDKVNDICRNVYPQLPAIMDQLTGLDEDTLDSPWGAIVECFVG